MSGIAENVSNTFFSVSGVLDLRGNAAEPSDLYQASGVIEDTTRPHLVSFDLSNVVHNDVPSVMVTLYFSKTMNSSFHCSDIAFQSARNSASLLVLSDAVCAVATTAASRNITFYAPTVQLSSYGERE